MSNRVSGVWIVLILAGCGLFGDDDPGIVIRTDENAYVPVQGSTISLRLTNRSDDPVFFICTGQIYLEELRGGDVAARWMIHGFEECLRPVAIAADRDTVFDLPFDDKSPLGNLNDAMFDGSVEYRATIDLFWDQQFKREVSAVERRSNRFTIIRNPVL